jgi:predicted esterase
VLLACGGGSTVHGDGMLDGTTTTATVTTTTGASTGAASSTGGSSSGDGTSSATEAFETSADTSTGEPSCDVVPRECPMPTPGELREVTGTPASPYLIRDPQEATAQTETVLFFPGGPGGIDTAMPTYALWLAEGDPGATFRVVVPYSADGDFQDEHDRALAILDELAACSCGSDRVHLGGTSLGGLGAYALALAHPERFVSLLGAPGAFDAPTAASVAALAGHSVLNAVGGDDGAWQSQVEASYQALLDAGVDSQLLVMDGQGHILDEAFDETVFFDFWSSH